MSDLILEFTGLTEGAQVFRHPVSGRSIRAGRNLAVRYIPVTSEEAPYLLSLGLFKVAHGAQSGPTAVARREEPRRIEPVFQQPEEESKPATAVSNPSEILVSFDDTEIDSSISWMTDEPKAEEILDINEVVDDNAETASEIVSETTQVVDRKVQRGRPKN